MKFHRIEITNITSLKGTTIIDFDEILSGEQIFAITGATGSGKSSILSAVALALYGASHKKSLNNDDFVTLGRSLGKVDLIFSSGNKKYTARWECRVTKKNGEALKTPKISRTVSHEDKILEQKAEDIIGLTFEQFCKTVILNQGEFARFITSNFGKRRDILEKLYGNETISLLGKELSNLLKRLTTESDQLKAKMDGALPYDEKEITLFESKLKEIQSQIESERLKQIPLQDLIECGKDLKELIEQRDGRQLRQSEIQRHLKEVTAHYNDLYSQQKVYQQELIQKESTLQEEAPRLQEAISVQREIEICKRYESDVIKRIETTNDSLRKIQDKHTNLNKQLKTAKDNILNLEDKNNPLLKMHPDEIGFLSQSIRELADLSQDKSITDQNFKHFKDIITKLQAKEDVAITAYSQLKNRDRELRKIISEHQDLEQITQDLKELKDFEKLSSSLNTSNTSLENLKLEHKKYALKIDRNDLEHEKIREALRNIRGEIDSLDLQHAHQKCLAESIRKSHCIICGSNLNNMDLKRKPPFKTVEELRKEEDGLYQKQMDIEVSLATLVEKNSNISEKIKTLEENAISEQEKLSAILKKHSLTTHNEIPSQIIRTEKNIANIKVVNDEAIKIRTQTDSLRLQQNEIRGELKKSHKNLENNERMLSSIIDKINKIRNKVSQSTLSYDCSVSELIAQFSKDNDNYQLYERERILLKSLQAESSNLSQNILSLEEQQKELATNREEHKTLLENLKSKIESLSPFGDPAKKLETISNEVRSLKLKLENHQRQLHHKEREKERLSTQLDSVIESLSDIHRLVITIINKSINSAQILAPLTENNDEVTNGLDKIQSINFQNISQDDYDYLSLFFQNVITPFYESEQTKFSALNEESSALKFKIEMFKSKQKEQEDALARIKTISEQIYIYQDLNELIGNNEFRNYTLGLIEKELLLHANNELQSLCDGRYEIFQQEKRSAQEFYIIDHWRGGLPRKISTLSGGETFLVSLAMALSLADMTRGQTEIDCFYIDEGFGSLDSESIEDALEILSRVRSRGKQIGIISHIELLTDRIPVNIQLRKSHFGESSITYNTR